MTKCPKCINEAQEPHACPYLSDVEEDRDTLCTCCEECTDNCAAEV